MRQPGHLSIRRTVRQPPDVGVRENSRSEQWPRAVCDLWLHGIPSPRIWFQFVRLLMSAPLRKICIGLGVCLVVSTVAVNGYIAQGWPPLDAIYMVVITLFGIGYGEVHPIVDPMLKIQTIALIVVGGLSGLYSVGGFFELLAAGEIQRALGVRRMAQDLKKLQNHTIICGFGRVGKMLAEDLRNRRMECVIIDINPDRVEEAQRRGFVAVIGDASNDEVLEHVGVDRAASLACVLPNDASNVFITLTAREINPRLEIVARAESPATDRKLRRSGADHVVMPAAIGAIRMAQIIGDGIDPHPRCPNDGHSDPTDFQVVTVAGRPELENKTLCEARQLLREIGEVVGLGRANGPVVVEHDETRRLGDHDVLLLASDRCSIAGKLNNQR